MKRIYFLALASAFFSSVFAVPQNGTIYVGPGGNDNNDGSSWTSAVASIAKGADLAKSGKKDVWIASGTYSVQSLVLSNYPGVGFYGGFQGVEGETVERRAMRSDDVKPWNFVNETIIDGNQGVIFTISGPAPAAKIIVDGITIQNGNGGTAAPLGILKPNFAFQNCKIQNNTSSSAGGAFNGFVDGSGETNIRNCYFYNNNSGALGGAMQLNLKGANWQFRIENCTFEKNSATATGGAIHKQNSGQLFISNCKFYDNFSAPSSTGADGGSALFLNSAAPDQVVNSLFYNNTGKTCITVVENTYLCNNTMVNNDGGIYINTGTNVKIYNTIVIGNTSGITGDFGYSVENCALDSDQTLPKNVKGKNNSTLTSATVALQIPTTFQGRVPDNDPNYSEKVSQMRTANFSLLPTSGAINKGVNSFFTDSEWGKVNSTDPDNQPRIQLRTIDIGAYESPCRSFAPVVVSTPDITNALNDPSAVISLDKPATGTVNYYLSTGTPTISGLNIKASPLDETPIELEIRNAASLTVTQDLSVEYDLSNSTGKWIFLSLPFNLNIEGGIRLVRQAGSTPVEREGKAEVDYGFRIYDSEHRSTGKPGSWWNVNQSGDPTHGEHSTLPGNATVLTAGTGFIFYLPASTTERTVRFYADGTATLASTVDKNVAYYGGGKANDAGWQLIGLPMTTQSINMSAAGESTGLPSFVYVYNGSTYVTQETASYSMRPFQGYFMQVSAQTNNWNFQTASKVNRTALPRSTKSNDSSVITLNMLRNGEPIDRSQIRFNPDASEEFVYNEDALKLVFGNEDRLATLSSGNEFSYNQLPSSSSVSLSSVVGMGSACTISRLDNAAGFTSVLIQNSRGGDSTDLLRSDFTLEEGKQLYTLRFYTSPTALDEPQTNRPFAFFDQETLHVVGLNGTAALYNTSGLKLWEGEVATQPQLNLSRGIYFLRTTDQEIKIVK